MIRIDEFSGPSDFDGLISSAEQVRFLLFGFSVPLAEAVQADIFLLSINAAKTFVYQQPAKTFLYQNPAIA